MAWYSNFADFMGTQLKTLQIASTKRSKDNGKKQEELSPWERRSDDRGSARGAVRAYLEEVSKEEEPNPRRSDFL